MTTGSDDFQALVQLVERTVGSLGRLQAIVDDTLEKLEALQDQLHAIEAERMPHPGLHLEVMTGPAAG